MHTPKNGIFNEAWHLCTHARTHTHARAAHARAHTHTHTRDRSSLRCFIADSNPLSVTEVTRQIPPAATGWRQPSPPYPQGSGTAQEEEESGADKAKKPLSSHHPDDVDPAGQLIIENIQVRTADGSDLVICDRLFKPGHCCHC